jgi:hypothetical protein
MKFRLLEMFQSQKVKSIFTKIIDFCYIITPKGLHLLIMGTFNDLLTLNLKS